MTLEDAFYGRKALHPRACSIRELRGSMEQLE